MAKVTIKDVAKEAEVSISTVSNALNGVDVLNPETKKKVMDDVEKLQYTPNLNGKYLKAGETKMIGIFTNSIAGQYFSTLLDSMYRQCERRGYSMNIFVTKDTDVIMGNIIGRRIDGAVIFEDTAVRDEEISKMEKADIAAVFLDREICRKRMASVLFDSYKSAFEEEFTYNAVKMFTRYQSERMPEAFLAGNDLSAIGCIKALVADGYRVPEDVSVMGFDDVDISKYYTPPLTTVSNPIARQGMLTIDTLIDMLNKKEEGSIKRLDGKLMIRESCAVKR